MSIVIPSVVVVHMLLDFYNISKPIRMLILDHLSNIFHRSTHESLHVIGDRHAIAISIDDEHLVHTRPITPYSELLRLWTLRFGVHITVTQ